MRHLIPKYSAGRLQRSQVLALPTTIEIQMALSRWLLFGQICLKILTAQCQCRHYHMTESLVCFRFRRPKPFKLTNVHILLRSLNLGIDFDHRQNLKCDQNNDKTCSLNLSICECSYPSWPIPKTTDRASRGEGET